jgi:hypothetical protein
MQYSKYAQSLPSHTMTDNHDNFKGFMYQAGKDFKSLSHPKELVKDYKQLAPHGS